MIKCVPELAESSTHGLDVAEAFCQGGNNSHVNSIIPFYSKRHSLDPPQGGSDHHNTQVEQQVSHRNHHSPLQQNNPASSMADGAAYHQLAELTWKDGQPAVHNLENRNLSRKSGNHVSATNPGKHLYASEQEWVSHADCDVLPMIDEDVLSWIHALNFQKPVAEKTSQNGSSTDNAAQSQSQSQSQAPYESMALGSYCSTNLSCFSQPLSIAKHAFNSNTDSIEMALRSNSEDDLSKTTRSSPSLTPPTNTEGSISCSDGRERATAFSDDGDAFDMTIASTSTAASPTPSMTQNIACKRKSYTQQESASPSDQEFQDKESSPADEDKPPQAKRSCQAKRSRAAAVHNQSERRRRDRINERMRTLQKLIPNSSKTDKASMLDEAIEYLKHLQAQLQVMMLRNGMGMPPMMMPPMGMSMQQLQMSMSMLASLGLGMGMA
eukprot:TRINITY_DN1604_c0_g1_i4.p1 TRINITY_DN1604_c0_g1~~TRINITY_DN1604_c0_g1_i4.p1  ORF type:complete len:438 (+),score=37.18 TRINITY_DN1604_c0_g1_i4:326-1639(+)